VARKAEDKRWNSKFGQFVQSYGAELLAARLEVSSAAIYHWVYGRTFPRPHHAETIQRLARQRRAFSDFSVADIHEHRRDARFRIRIPVKKGAIDDGKRRSQSE
jgi:hypothetical protein